MLRSDVNRRWSIALALVLGGCVAEEPAIPDRVGVRWFGVKVRDITGCSTGAVAGLSDQLIAEQNCLRPGVLVSFKNTPNVTVPSHVNAMLEPPAVTALQLAAQQASEPIVINSAFRTLAQQYLLNEWEGSCGISIAATPGSSNHETGLALDVDNYAASRTALEAAGWKWYGAGDVVHFDFIDPDAGTVDLRSDSVLGFQRLYNRNHPQAPITEDGAWGPETEAALGDSPAEGFPIGAECDDPPTDLAPPPDLIARLDLDGARDLTSAPRDLGGLGDDLDAIPTGRTVYGGCRAGGGSPTSLYGLVLIALALSRRTARL